MLADDHRARAHANGWTDETIALWGIRTEADPKTIRRMLKWAPLDPRNVARGIAFPVWIPGEARPAHHRFRPDAPWKVKDKKSGEERDSKYIGPAKTDSLPIFPPRARANGWLKDPTKPLHITEGEFKTGILDQLGYAALGCSGVWMLYDKKRSAELGRSTFRPEVLERVTWEGRTVVIVFDADTETNPGVRDAENELALMARNAGAAETKIVRIPLGGPKGIDDFFAAYGEVSTRELLAAASSVEPKEKTRTEKRARILVHEDEHDVTTHAMAAVARASRDIFTWGFSLAEVVSTEDASNTAIRRPPGALVIRPMPKAKLREEIARAVYFFKVNDDGDEKPQHVPPWCVDAFHARGTWPGFRALNGIVEHPILREDGSILSKPGFDPATGLFVRNELDVHVPERPAREDAARACGELLDVFADFPIADDASKSGLLAAVLTPFAKFAYRGPSPLALIDANTRGSGKTMIADVIATIVTGRSMPRMTYDPHEEEMRKRITALAFEGAELVLIDNIATTFGNASLDAAITGETWKDRVLGKTETIEKPLNATWFATGNNVVVAADTARRTMRVRLESPLENPESRASAEFAHPDLLAWVRVERARLTVAALTVLRAYVLAGRPPATREQWGSFEGWSRVVRDAVVWSGYTDPKETQQALHDSGDIEVTALRGILSGLAHLDWSDRGLTVREILDALSSDTNDELEGLRSAIDTLARPRGGPPTSVTVGKMLHRFVGRIAEGRALGTEKDRKGFSVWRVRRTGLPRVQRVAEDVSVLPTRGEKNLSVVRATQDVGAQAPRQPSATLGAPEPVLDPTGTDDDEGGEFF